MGVPTGSNLGAAQGSITIDTSQAQQAPQVMAGVAAGINNAMASVNASVNKTQAGISSLTGVLNKLAGAFGVSLSIAGVVQVARMGVELVKTAADAERTERQFRVLAAGVGQSADKMLAAMQKASDGMISDNELILSANKAMLLGVAKNSEELSRLLEASRVLGQAMGQDVSKSFNDLVIGLGRLSPLILDNLGIANEGEEMFENYAKSVGRTADSLSRAEKQQILLNKVLEAAQPLLDAEGKSADDNAKKFDRLGTSWSNAMQTLGEMVGSLGVLGVGLNALASVIDYVNDRWKDAITLVNGFKYAVDQVKGALGFEPPVPAAGVAGVPKWMTGVSRAASGPLIPEEEIQQIKLDWAEGVTELNERLHDNILEQTNSYNRQREDAEEDYHKRVTREARDFAIQRQRQEADLVESIADIHEDAGRRELRMARDLARSIARSQADSAERIAEAREDTTERLVELEEDFAKNRERAAEQHRDRLLSAAGRLDAIALLEERKRWAQENRDAKEAHKEQRDDLQEQLQERIDDENKALQKSIDNANEAHRRQLEDAREADRLRIQDMQDDFKKRREQEDADRDTRLGDMADDHADQLAEMDRAQNERLTQISRHAGEQRDKLDEEAKKELDALHKRNEAREKEVKEAEKLWDDFMDHVDETLKARLPKGVLEPGLHTPQGPYIPQYANGGWVEKTGLAMVHRGEFVMPQPMAAAASGMGRTISIGSIQATVTIGNAGGRSDEYILDLVENGMIRALEKVAGG